MTLDGCRWKHSSGRNRVIVSRVFSYRVPDSVAPYLYFVGNTMSFLPPKNSTHNITHTMPQSANSTNSETIRHRRQTQIDSQSDMWQTARADTRRWLMSLCTCISFILCLNFSTLLFTFVAVCVSVSHSMPLHICGCYHLGLCG